MEASYTRSGVEFYEDPEHPYLTIDVDEYNEVTVVNVGGTHMQSREYETDRRLHSHTYNSYLEFADSLAESLEA